MPDPETTPVVDETEQTHPVEEAKPEPAEDWRRRMFSELGYDEEQIDRALADDPLPESSGSDKEQPDGEQPEPADGEDVTDPPKEDKPKEDPPKKTSVSVKKPKKEEPDFEEPEKPAPLPPPKPDDATPIETPESVLKGLEVPEEFQNQVDLAVFAESLNDRYKGKALSVAKFVREDLERRQAIERAKGSKRDDLQEEYNEWFEENKPTYRSGEYEALRDAKVRHDATQDALRKSEKRFEEYERDLKRIKIKPELEKASAETSSYMVQDVEGLPEDLAEALKSKPLDEVITEFEEEGAIIQEHIQAADEVVNTYISLRQNAERFDPNNQTHQNIVSFIDREAEFFLKNGKTEQGDLRVKGGKSFRPPADYYSMTPEQQKRYWTWSDDDIVTIMRMQIKNSMVGRVSKERERLEKWANRRQPKKEDPPKKESPPLEKKEDPPAPSSRSSASSMPGPASSVGGGSGDEGWKSALGFG